METLGAENDFIGTFFRLLQRNQLEEVKQNLKRLKLTLPSVITAEDVSLINSLKIRKSGDTPLHICAKNGFLELLKYFVEEEHANLELMNFDGKTALHDAAQFSQSEVLEYLLSKGANVNVVKKSDWTPLMLACTKNNLSVVKALMAAGADMNFVNKDGWSCIHIAAREGNNDILSFLLRSCNDSLRAALIEKKSRNGRKAIHTAVLHGHLETVKLLSKESTVEQLSLEDNCGSTPLLDACRCGFTDIVEYLIQEIKLDPTVVNKNGVGLLHVAAEANQANMIDFLVTKYNLDVNKPSDLLSFTPLHWASREGNLSVVKVLIKHGAKLHAMDIKGRTAKDIAREFSRTEVFQYYDTYSIDES